jgi:pyruvyl transferase EpsO
MLFSDKIMQIRNNIEKALTSLITHDYWLLELPYYTNIGDILIWHGTEYFLKKLEDRCTYTASSATFRTRRIDANTIILLQGGGNFGDLWNEPHAFRCKIISAYPDNVIIILPQTVFYLDKNNLMNDRELFSKHKKLIICARDMKSYQLLNEYFNANTVLLVPDMAFCIPMDSLQKRFEKSQDKNLFLKRNDRELKTSICYENYIDNKAIDISDWPSMEKDRATALLLRCLFGLNRRIPFLFSRLTDFYASFFFKPDMIRTGVKFICEYNKVYTTRLHAAILCCLLEKPFVLFDNSYGKNRSFFETWLTDLDGAEFR